MGTYYDCYFIAIIANKSTYFSFIYFDLLQVAAADTTQQ